MKRRLHLVVAAVALFALSGCIDVVQYISGDAFTVDVYLRLTLQKSPFELANNFSDEPQDVTELFTEEFELSEETVTADLPPGVSAEYSVVDSEFDYGFELRYSAPRSLMTEAQEDNPAFVPIITARGLQIPFDPVEASADEGGGDEFAAAFLGGAKYRLMISKRLVSRISQAMIVNATESRPVLVTDLPDVWMIEFPASQWLNTEPGTYLDVRF